MIHKFIIFVKDVLEQLKDPVNIVIYLLVLVAFFSPCIIGYTYTLITHRARGTAIATAYWLFWAGPFTNSSSITSASMVLSGYKGDSHDT